MLVSILPGNSFEMCGWGSRLVFSLIAPNALGNAATVNAVQLDADRLPAMRAHNFGKPTKQCAISRVHGDFQGIEALLAGNVLSAIPINTTMQPACWCVPWVVEQRVSLTRLFGSGSFCGHLHSPRKDVLAEFLLAVCSLPLRPAATPLAASCTSLSACLFPGKRSTGARASARQDNCRIRSSDRIGRIQKTNTGAECRCAPRPSRRCFHGARQARRMAPSVKPTLRLTSPGGLSSKLRPPLPH